MTGQRPPNEVYLVAEVNAGVAEQRRLLGLLPGRRRMLLGLPLLGGLTVPQLRAVLAHEFGHYGNLDTRLGAVTMHGREALQHTVEAFQEGSTRLHHAIGALYVGYARMFLRTSQSVARHQELAADQTAARHAGRDATAAALRVVPVLAATYTHYLEAYAAMGSRWERYPLRARCTAVSVDRSPPEPGSSSLCSPPGSVRRGRTMDDPGRLRRLAAGRARTAAVDARRARAAVGRPGQGRLQVGRVDDQGEQ
ncbi:M48 family metallopeptidase [Streptomyces mirabilis]|uniref:M48 family metallopeptidase n=1 Tax=Streptomyces mirabilis TaxID=68239 RepID=UPI00362C43EC